ncbi:hypothetical protein PRCB_08030 [Pantoea rodasii]|uniref:Uncharacterized protein n=1 Tax=Pantoea rodasii TaxID=1076549 RepID=A0A2M9WGF9_9GAMM|nr:hypothetical protein HA45_14940 [Pantoea rodasii]PJZ06653.1 hypothetical protein PRCB_08030 [Pantoea rodasii]
MIVAAGSVPGPERASPIAKTKRIPADRLGHIWPRRFALRAGPFWPLDEGVAVLKNRMEQFGLVLKALLF